MARVRIGTCAGPADAALVRSVFEAHGIPIVIGAEQHASLLGGLGGPFLSLDIWVDSSRAEEAATLLHETRSGETLPPEEGDEDGDEPDDVEIDGRVERRRRTGIGLLLACCVTFGTGHMYSGAWLRGIALAGAEAAGFRMIGPRPAIGALLIAGAVAIDLVGTIWRLAAPRATLPPARVRRRRG